MKASTLSFQAAVVFIVAGMIWGIFMAISDDHSAMPAHAHLNLLGWVSLFLFGIYYRLHPWLEGAKSLFEKSGMSVFSKQIAAHSDEDHGV